MRIEFIVWSILPYFWTLSDSPFLLSGVSKQTQIHFDGEYPAGAAQIHHGRGEGSSWMGTLVKVVVQQQDDHLSALLH